MDIADPSTLSTKLYNLGCTLGTHDLNTAGTQDNVVILLFGKPAYASSTYGSYVWSARGSNSTVFLSTSRIAAGVEQFAKGYYVCTQADNSSHLYVAPGLNNVGSAVAFNRGAA